MLNIKKYYSRLFFRKTPQLHGKGNTKSKPTLNRPVHTTPSKIGP